MLKPVFSKVENHRIIRPSKVLLGAPIRYRTTGNTANKTMGHPLTGWSNLLDSDDPTTVVLSISSNNLISSTLDSGPFRERYQVFKFHHPLTVANFFCVLSRSAPSAGTAMSFSAILIRRDDGVSWNPDTLTYATRFTIPAPTPENSITFNAVGQSGGQLSGLIEYENSPDNPVIGMAIKVTTVTYATVIFEWHVEDLQKPVTAEASVISRSSSGFDRTLTFDGPPNIKLNQRIRVQDINSHYNDILPQVKPGGSVKIGYSLVTAVAGNVVTYTKEDSESYSEATTASSGTVYIW